MAKKYIADTFEGGAGNLTSLVVNTDDFVVTGSGGNVGIGESVPSKPLTINKNQSETAILVQSSDTGTAGIYIGGQSDSIKGGLILDNSDNSLQLRGYNNANRLHIDSSGNVGIGTTDPQKKLVISESTNATIRINSTKNGTWTAEEGLGHLEFFGNDTSGEGATVKAKISATSKDTFGAAFNMTFGTTDGSTGISERMRIRYDGNVGIGTSSPEKLLHIASTSAQSVITLQRTNSNTTGAIGALQWTALDNHTVASMVALGDGNDEGAHITFNTTSAASSNDPYGISERMRIDSNGNVGIGTGANVDEILHIQGSVDNDDIALKIENTFDDNSSATPPSAAVVFTTASNNGHIRVFGAPANTAANHKMDIGATASTSYLTFSPNGSEKMRIDSSGNVEIGTSSARPDEINDNGIAIHNSGKQYQFSSSDFAVLKSSSTGTKIFFRYGTSGSQNTQIGSISYPTTSSVAYNTTSDYRLKENVVDMTGALDRVEQLQPKRFNFIQDPEITFDGFLAHEVQSVIPEAITGEKDAVDDEGNPEYQGIDQSKIVPLLVGAIKELKAEIETLKSQINS